MFGIAYVLQRRVKRERVFIFDDGILSKNILKSEMLKSFSKF